MKHDETWDVGVSRIEILKIPTITYYIILYI
jgi:hypothetical protein